MRENVTRIISVVVSKNFHELKQLSLRSLCSINPWRLNMLLELYFIVFSWYYLLKRTFTSLLLVPFESSVAKLLKLSEHNIPDSSEENWHACGG